MEEINPNKSVTSINIDRLSTPVKRKKVSGWTKLTEDTNPKQVSRKDWKSHNRERHTRQMQTKKKDRIGNLNSNQGYSQGKKKKSQWNQKTENY